MAGEAGGQHSNFYSGLQPLLIYRGCPASQSITCSAGEHVHLSHQQWFKTHCHHNSVLWVPGAMGGGGNFKQSTWKRPPLHLYSALTILAPPLPASRLSHSPPTPHYQLPKAPSLPFAFAPVTTVASAICVLRTLCQVLLRAGGTLQLKTEASAALDQSTYFKGVVIECKT